VSEGVRAAIVANRSYDRAARLAATHGARAMHFDECWAELKSVDLLISSTAAPHAIVTREQVSKALQGRASEPFCILDIALPRDVESSVGDLDNVFLYDIDDLSGVVNANIERRLGELPSAEAVVGEELDRYWRWLSGLAAVPVLTRFRQEMDAVRERELQVALKRLRSLSPEEIAAVESFSRSLMNKFLHTPSVRLREAATIDGGLGVIDAVQYLFALDDQDEKLTHPADTADRATVGGTESPLEDATPPEGSDADEQPIAREKS
jgi:glutamyl-tRNA reductase